MPGAKPDEIEKFLAANGRKTQRVEHAAALMVSFSSGSIFGQAEVDVGCDNKPLAASLWLLKPLDQLFTERKTSTLLPPSQKENRNEIRAC